MALGIKNIETDEYFTVHGYWDKAKEFARKFKIGDFIYNVIGIIKIEAISYNIFEKFETINIVYRGYRYKKVYDVLSRTKDKKLSNLTHDLKIIESPILK